VLQPKDVPCGLSKRAPTIEALLVPTVSMDTPPWTRPPGRSCVQTPVEIATPIRLPTHAVRRYRGNATGGINTWGAILHPGLEGVGRANNGPAFHRSRDPDVPNCCDEWKTVNTVTAPPSRSTT